MTEQREDQNMIATVNRNRNQYNLLELRLDTTSILNDVKMFLNAEIEVIDQNKETGEYKRAVIKVGIPKANKRGIASILNWLSLTINPHAVQGNFTSDRGGVSKMYNDYIYEFQTNLMDELMINIYNYDINENEIQGIVDAVMNLIIPFMTRPIQNKERESYGETFKEITSNTTKDRSKFPVFSQ